MELTAIYRRYVRELFLAHLERISPLTQDCGNGLIEIGVIFHLAIIANKQLDRHVMPETHEAIASYFTFKKFGMILLAVCFLLPAQADPAEKTGVYVDPKFALNVQHSKGKLSFEDYTLGSDSKTGTRAGGALAIGYDFAHRYDLPVRIELEYGAYGNISKINTLLSDGSNNLDLGVEVGIQTLLANMYWNFAEWKNFTPYIGAGLGMAFVKTEGNLSLMGLSASKSNTEAVFAGQFGLGCTYAFNDIVSADLSYRFLMMGDGKVSYNGLKRQARKTTFTSSCLVFA